MLESQFEKNPHFRAIISKQNGTDLRSQPLGKDKLGNAYWSTLDDKCNLRIYQEHLDEEIWKVVATNRDEMVNLISCLKGNKLVLPSLVGVIDEDSSSNSMPPKIDALQNGLNSKESSNDGHDSIKKENIPNLKIKLNIENKEQSTVEQIKNEINPANDTVKDEGTILTKTQPTEAAAAAISTTTAATNTSAANEYAEEDDEEVASNVSEIDEMSQISSENSSATAGTRSNVSEIKLLFVAFIQLNGFIAFISFRKHMDQNGFRCWPQSLHLTRGISSNVSEVETGHKLPQRMQPQHPKNVISTVIQRI